MELTFVTTTFVKTKNHSLFMLPKLKLLLSHFQRDSYRGKYFQSILKLLLRYVCNHITDIRRTLGLDFKSTEMIT